MKSGLTILAAFILASGSYLTSMRENTRPRAAPSRSQPTIRITESDKPFVAHMVRDLVESVKSDRPENSYFTPFMKQALRWVIQGNADKQIDFELIEKYHPLDRGILVAADYKAGKPVIYIYAPLLLEKFRGDFQGPEPHRVSVVNKHWIAFALVHETWHLMQSAFFFSIKPDSVFRRREEARVWVKVNYEAVRPLRLIGQPIPEMFARVDDILRACRDQPNDCPEFHDVIVPPGLR